MSRRLPATIALCGWTLLVWTTRIGNIWGDDDLSRGDKWGSTALALSFTVFALAAAHAVYHRTSWRGLVVKAFVGWTIGVWLVRSLGIVSGDHEATFIIVHLVLAAISIGLAVIAVREEAKLNQAPGFSVAE